MHLFSNVKYHVSSSLNLDDQTIIATLLDANGAIQESLSNATHIITNSPEFEGWQGVREDVAIVTSKWVERSTVLGKCQPTKFYSADPSMLFSGIVACAADVMPADVEVLTGTICALGGQWRAGLTRDVTHLFALTTTSEKYHTAMHFQKDTRVKVLVPHWFDDVVRLGVANLPTLQYEWPDPKVLQSSESLVQDNKRSRKPTESQASLFKSTIFANTSDTTIPDKLGSGAELLNIWKGKRILLSRTLELSPGRLEAIEAGIERYGGVVIADVRSLQEEASKVDEADVFITRYRSGAAYIKALKSKEKLVGALAWLFHVQTIRAITPPTDRLLHYPIPETKVEGFDKHEITVTNYTGDYREYLKGLIQTMGGKFTPSMSPKNTVVVAAFISGNKTERAQHWSIPIVNHTWLEDCFVRWKDLTVGLEKYIKFPPGFDFSIMLGDKGIGRKVLLEDAELDVPESGNLSTAMDVDMRSPPQSSAKEVEAAVRVDGDDLDDGGDVVMANNTRADGEISIAKAKQSAPEPEDELMESSLPPPPKKLVRRAGTRYSLPDLDQGSPGPSVTIEDTGGSPARSTGKGTRVYGKKSGARGKITEDDDEFSPFKNGASSGEGELPARSTSKTSSGTRPSTTKDNSQRGSDTEGHEASPLRQSERGKSGTTAKAGSVTHRRSLRNSPFKLNEIDINTDDDATIRTVKVQTPKQTRTHTITRAPTLPTLDSSSHHGPSPRRLLSVLVPPKPDYLSPRGGKYSPSSLKKNPSLHIQAAEALVQNGKRIKPSVAKKRNKRRSTSVEDIAMGDISSVAGPSKQADSEVEVPGVRLKRSAASKASQKLRDVIMPDVMNFEKELKKGTIMNEWEGKGKRKASNKRLSTADEHEDDEQQPELKKPRISDQNKRQKTKSAPGVKFAKLREPSDDEDEMEMSPRKVSKRPKKPESDEDNVEGKKVTAKTDRNKKRKASLEYDDDEVITGSTKAADVRIMTTKVQLPDDTVKALSKLGVKITTKMSDCTHLIAKNFGRTEKILCAIAVSPYILRDEWAMQSAAKKRLLPEEDFLLSDEETETKYEFSMAESLKRAKENHGKLLDGHTFYVTPKVQVDMKLLKNVVVAHGGQLVQQPPTIRILNGKENRHTISCEEDISIWRPLSEQGHPIYSKELLLTGILKQDIGYDDDAYRVDRSR